MVALLYIILWSPIIIFSAFRIHDIVHVSQICKTVRDPEEEAQRSRILHYTLGELPL